MDHRDGIHIWILNPAHTSTGVFYILCSMWVLNLCIVHPEPASPLHPQKLPLPFYTGGLQEKKMSETGRGSAP